ncbi:hypothetical protein I5703_15570, partial [Acinetobacter bereziniae]|nr:hypothetical protein [Acinetobacter bereziniae]
SNLLKHPEFKRVELQEKEDKGFGSQQSDDTLLILDESKKQQDKVNELENLIVEEIDTINRITDKKSLIDYAKNKYEQDLKLSSSVKTLQSQVVELIKQFGVV